MNERATLEPHKFDRGDEGAETTEVIRQVEGDILDIDWRGWTGPSTRSCVTHLRCMICRHDNDPAKYILADNVPKIVQCQECGVDLEVVKTVNVDYTSRLPK